MNIGEYDVVGDLMFSQKGASQTHQSVLEISRNTRICRLSVGCIIHSLIRDTHPEENNVSIRLLMYSQVV